MLFLRRLNNSEPLIHIPLTPPPKVSLFSFLVALFRIDPSLRLRANLQAATTCSLADADCLCLQLLAAALHLPRTGYVLPTHPLLCWGSAAFWCHAGLSRRPAAGFPAGTWDRNVGGIRLELEQLLGPWCTPVPALACGLLNWTGSVPEAAEAWVPWRLLLRCDRCPLTSTASPEARQSNRIRSVQPEKAHRCLPAGDFS